MTTLGAFPPGTRELGAAAPLRLDDPDRFWVLAEGSASLFFVQDEQGRPGARRYVCSLEQGAAVFPLPQGTAGLLIVPFGTARVVPGDLGDFAARLAAGEAEPTALHAAWMRCVEGAWEAGAPSGVLEAAAGAGRVDLAAGSALQGTTNPLWCKVVAGSPVWDAFGRQPLGVGDCVPLGAGTALVAVSGPVSLEVCAGQGLGGPLAARQALDGAATRLLHALEAREQATADQRRTRFERRVTEEKGRLRRTVGALTSLIGRRAGGSVPEADPLLEACRIVGRSRGIAVRPPARSEDMSRVADPIDAVARASRFRTRRVILMPPWWERDNGPLLGYRIGSRAPVALLPISGGYELHDPSTGGVTRVDAAVADGLEPFAMMIYGALPEGKPSPLALLRFATRGNYGDLAWVAGLGVVGSLLGMIVPQVTGMLIDTAIPDSDRTLVLEMGAGLVMATLAQAVFTVCQGVMLQRVEARADATGQAGVWDRVLNLGAPFFRKYEIGDLCGRIMAISAIRQSLSGQVLGSALSGVFALLNLGLMFSYSPQLTGVAVALTFLTVAVTGGLTVLRMRTAQPLRELEGNIQGTVIQLLNGVAKLRTAGAEARAFAHWGAIFHQRVAIRRKLQDIDNVMDVVNELLPVISNMAIFWVAAAAFGLEVQGKAGGLPTGLFLAFNAANATFLGGVSQLAGVLVAQLDLSIMWQRALPVLTEKPETSDDQLDPGRLSGRIALEHVTFRYEENGRTILDDVTLHVEPGQHVAFVGPSGCGKSTIFRLLLGFEVPESGIVSFDRQDLQTLDARAVRRQMGVVLQAGRLAAGSIFDNITSGALMTPEEVWEAIRGAGMEDDIKGMPMGLHTIVSEGGSNLSGGQRQRLLIARALALKPRIVLFDEATSALDNHTQAIVSATLDRMRATRIVIAHRLSTIRQADKIVVLDAGKVIQVGSFDELANQEGLFARLVARQSI
jgi:NHLM bacteriocin system ABC transporter ATP-binding protein